jgi:uncharacterized membrane protein
MSRDLFLFLVVFAACAVEGVEAVTIVLAVGVTRGWRAASAGAGAALLTLAMLVVGLGPSMTRLPIDVLRLIVGGLLLNFGLQWLRKAILRAAGAKALHDETAIFAGEVAELGATRPTSSGIDRMGFAVSFKGVLLEGLEVVFVVLTLGANGHHMGLAALAALSALAIVVGAGAVARAPLSRVPENTLKYGVGVLLTSFGLFWGAEGAGAIWPGADLAIPGLIVVVLATSATLHTTIARRLSDRPVIG